MRMGLCNMIESSEEIGEPKREKNFSWGEGRRVKTQRSNEAQIEAGSYRAI